MTRPAFTPGPWYVQPSDAKNRIGEYTVRGADLPNKQSPGDWFICNTFTGMEAEEANAHLIAAAPDLYAALTHIARDACEHYTTGPLSCHRHGRTVDAKYGADRMCLPCIAVLALQKADGHETR